MADLVDSLRANVRRAQLQATRLLQNPDVVILDTETTGLTGAYICDLAVIRRGGVVFNTLVNPGLHIPEEASRIHGIFDKDVEDAPTFEELWDSGFEEMLDTKLLVIYNAPYDLGVIDNEMSRLGVTRTIRVRSEDALRLYQQWYFGGIGRSGKGQTKLTTAHCDSPECVDAVNTHAQAGAHRAYADCQATVTRLRIMSESCWLHDHWRGASVSRNRTA
jgi:DNA polymerase III epsilon subunit-like protein